MDTHDVSRGRGSFKDVLKQVNIPVNVVGVDSDHLYPVHEQKELATYLANAEYNEVQSPYGHDAFLIEFEQLRNIIQPFLEKQHSYTY
jgi:homoserine O-acetyltransferase/O-succinyltransferase